MLGKGLYTLIKNVSFSSPTNIRSHNPPHFGAHVLAGTRSLFQFMWEPSIPTPFGVQLLADTLPVTPLRGSASSLAHRPVSDSDTICNSLSTPLADIVLFDISSCMSVD